jgi:chromosome segregation ATPase
MPPEAWIALGSVVAAGFAYLGARYTACQSRSAQVVSKEIEEKAVDAAAYERARESYEAAIANYEREATRYEERLANLQRRIIGLNEEILTVEEAKREQHAATLAELTRVRADFERHVAWCNTRIDRLRSRLASGESIASTDPDLQTTH